MFIQVWQEGKGGEKTELGERSELGPYKGFGVILLPMSTSKYDNYLL